MRFKRKVRELTGRTRGISIEQMTKELAATYAAGRVTSASAETPSVLRNLDQWIRRQAAIHDLEAVETGKVRFAKLCALGVSKDLAAQTAGSAHGPWRIANSPALSYAFPNAYFDKLGVPRLFAGP